MYNGLMDRPKVGVARVRVQIDWGGGGETNGVTAEGDVKAGTADANSPTRREDMRAVFDCSPVGC
jgi:hypothetical protein